MKPLLPPPPDETPSTPAFEPDKVVQDVLANADPSLAEAVREFVAAQPGEWKGPVIAVITESAEPVYVNEKRDTVEASPLSKLAEEIDAAPSFAERMTAEIEPIAPASDTTASVIVRFDESPAIVAPRGTSVEAIAHAVPATAATADTQKVDAETKVDHEPPSVPEEPVDTEDKTAAPSESPAAPHEPDKIAEERGIPPLRLPKLSAAFVPIRDAVRSMSSRSVVIASVSVATVSVAVAVGAVMWARGAVADPRPVVAPAPPTSERIETLPAAQLAVQPAGTCALTVRASSPEAIVWLDGAQVGVAPQTITGECKRTALVEVRHPRYADFKRELAIDGDLEIDAQLEREKTELTVWSDPAGAEVVFEGRVLGRTPLTTTVNRYEVGELIFNANGYQTDWRRIVPKQAKKTVAITLKKAR